MHGDMRHCHSDRVALLAARRRSSRLSLVTILPLVAVMATHGCVPEPPPAVSSLDMSPAWSPSGHFLAYVHQDLMPSPASYPSGVYVVEVATLRRITISLGYARSVDWLRDGRRLVFDSSGGLLIGDTLGTAPSSLFNGSAYFPDCASTSDTVAFDDISGIGLVDTGTGSALFPADLSIGRDPAWSPDDSRFALLRAYPGSSAEEIAIYNRRSRSFIRVTNNTYPDRAPTWSPDGSRLAWIAWPPGGLFSAGPWLQVADTLGSTVSRITRAEGGPDWSPDGTQIAFTTTSGSATSVYVITLSSGSIRRITS